MSSWTSLPLFTFRTYYFFILANRYHNTQLYLSLLHSVNIFDLHYPINGFPSTAFLVIKDYAAYLHFQTVLCSGANTDYQQVEKSQ